MRKGSQFGLMLLVAALLAVPVASANPRTTESNTIVDSDGDNRLDRGPGEKHRLRSELGTKTPLANPLHLTFFGQFTDKHVVDEESPLRVEFTDRYGLIFTSAYRPQEGLSAHVVDQMVEQIRNTTSPVNGRRIEFLMTTGDNTDNTQCNETRWMIDLLDGDKEVDPNSGVEGGTSFTPRQVCVSETSPPAVSATAAACDVPGDSIYDGVRGGGEYYEPDSSKPAPGNDAEDGPGYSPDQAENEREAGRSTSVRDFRGLYETMNTPFEATGLDVPWYGIFGNHDGLIQGNQPRNAGFEALATGCTKITGLPAEDERALTTSSDKPTAFANLLASMLERAEAGEAPFVRDIAADPRRRPLRKSEYIAEHFKSTGLPAGHGFTPANVASGMGNYAFNPKPGLKFVVLDTIAEHGLEEGNIDDDQFRWLHEELLLAKGKKELVVVFAHHSLRTMGQPPVSPFAPGDTGGNLSPVVHFGEGLRNSGQPLPCVVSDPALPPGPTETLKCLLLRHRNVIAFVNGHEHANRITPYERATGAGPVAGGFWEINTASHIDWPQQSRTLDIIDNRDGSLSIVATVLDHAAPPRSDSVPPRDGGKVVGDGVKKLASISRELSFNDPHASTEDNGQGGARGSVADRNVELVVRDPR